MREGMINKPHSCPGRAELPQESFCPAPLMPHPQKMHRSGYEIQVGDRQSTGSKTFQIVTESRSGCRPAKAHLIELLRTDACKIQARLNCQCRKSGIMFQT